MKASDLLFWKRTSRKQLEIIDRLTKALIGLKEGQQEVTKVCQGLLENPERLGDILRRAVQVAQGPVIMMTGQPTPAALTSREVLSLPPPEALREQIDVVTKAVLAKMDQMEKHVAEAVSQLSPDVLKLIAKKLEQGEDFTLRRRHGCIHLDFGTGDNEFYLRL